MKIARKSVRENVHNLSAIRESEFEYSSILAHRPPEQILGSLRNDDGFGNDNAKKQ